MGNLTGRRLVDTVIDRTVEDLTFVDNGQVFGQQRITEVFTRFYERPYDYGVGLQHPVWLDSLGAQVAFIQCADVTVYICQTMWPITVFLL